MRKLCLPDKMKKGFLAELNPKPKKVYIVQLAYIDSDDVPELHIECKSLKKAIHKAIRRFKREGIYANVYSLTCYGVLI